MTETGPSIQRQQRLQDLAAFAPSLAGALIKAGTAPDHVRGTFIQAVSGECEQCGMGIGGEELYGLAQAPEAGRQSARIIRLRKGYCAREGCTSNFCRLTFASRAGLDWTKLLEDAGRAKADLAVETAALQPAPVTRRMNRRRLAVRASLVLLAVIALFVFRQWYRGGTIPFFREPEHFKVDVIEHEPGMPTQ